jgi:hypothetical protein
MRIRTSILSILLHFWGAIIRQITALRIEMNQG